MKKLKEEDLTKRYSVLLKRNKDDKYWGEFSYWDDFAEAEKMYNEFCQTYECVQMVVQKSKIEVLQKNFK